MFLRTLALVLFLGAPLFSAGCLEPTAGQTGLCENVTCPASPPSCQGNQAWPGSPAGVCDPETGECIYDFPLQGPDDCTEEGLVCEQGKCVKPTGACEDVTCPAIAPTCEGNVAYPGLDEGFCHTETGECLYDMIDIAPTDCAEEGLVCTNGACIDPSIDACEDDGFPCTPDSMCDRLGCGPNAPGVCIPVDLECTFLYEPVCGCDGITYANDCVRQMNGAALDHEGECEAPNCDPMDAWGVGPCEAEVGFKWNGSECFSFSGCECEGSDCAKVFDSLEACEEAFIGCLGPEGIDPCQGKSCGEPCSLCPPGEPCPAIADEGTVCNEVGECVSPFETTCIAPSNCDPTDASSDGPCPAFWGWAWNGETCVPISGCDCKGADCNDPSKMHQTLDACLDAQSACGLYVGCDGKTCGDPCEPCAPWEDCELVAGGFACDANGACVPSNGQICPVDSSSEVAMCEGNTLIATDPFTVQDAFIISDTLTLLVNYSGGCEEHEFGACALQTDLDVPGYAITLSHNANNDLCEAWITDELTFDLSALKEDWMVGTGEKTGTVPIVLDGYPSPLSYMF